ncbi:helix-turn-helix domain-containing protein [Halosimplex aquaticum]|uniref:Helix-turn-helix domain-containing protein n=1 Tax=Halosimplex aquaticum TaxID=3026162 RepID=A0ABD5Y178_9EURY|nr:helix-turn-helix domain-containing protein [Halosimplex aquaticum]
MATIAEFTAKAADSPIGELLAQFPDETIEIERLKEFDQSFAVYFWITSPAPNSVESEFTELGLFTSVDVVDTLGDEVFVRAHWNPEREGVLRGIFSADVILESAILSQDGWSIRLRADTAEPLSVFQNYCLEHGFKMRMSRFPTLVQVFNSPEYNLSAEQRAGLALAYEQGYFEEPRETTLEELAKTLEITPEAVLARIRKGERNLIENTVVRSVNEIS